MFKNVKKDILNKFFIKLMLQQKRVEQVIIVVMIKNCGAFHEATDNGFKLSEIKKKD